jgi:hypothetical protein
LLPVKDSGTAREGHLSLKVQISSTTKWQDICTSTNHC